MRAPAKFFPFLSFFGLLPHVSYRLSLILLYSLLLPPFRHSPPLAFSSGGRTRIVGLSAVIPFRHSPPSCRTSCPSRRLLIGSLTVSGRFSNLCVGLSPVPASLFFSTLYFMSAFSARFCILHAVAVCRDSVAELVQTPPALQVITQCYRKPEGKLCRHYITRKISRLPQPCRKSPVSIAERRQRPSNKTSPLTDTYQYAAHAADQRRIAFWTYGR